jgi:hypothetical protein
MRSGYVTTYDFLLTYGTVSFRSVGISAISEAFHVIADRRRRTDGLVWHGAAWQRVA